MLLQMLACTDILRRDFRAKETATMHTNTCSASASHHSAPFSLHLLQCNPKNAPPRVPPSQCTPHSETLTGHPLQKSPHRGALKVRPSQCSPLSTTPPSDPTQPTPHRAAVQQWHKSLCDVQDSSESQACLHKGHL